jgi:hypothetical protein
MPALPTTGLTAHYRADVTTNLFKTYVSSGVHTGTPVDGDRVEVWDNTAGIADQMFTWTGSNTQSPLYRTVTPLMAHNCLDFNGGRFIKAYNQTGTTAKALSSYLANNAFTVIAAIYPQAIPTSNANVYNTDPILADYGQFWGLFLRDLAGVKQIAGYNWDGTADVIALTITTAHTWIVVFQHDSGNLKLSLIDETATETAATPVASGNTTNLTNNLGLASTGGPSANFRIGEFAIWNTALTGGTDLADAKQYFIDAWPPGGVIAGPSFQGIWHP